MQNGRPNPEAEPEAGSTATLRHLSGTRRGQVETLRSKTLHIIKTNEQDLRIVPADGIVETNCVSVGPC